MQPLIDTNILLRYVLKDNEDLTKRASRIIAENNVICLNAVVYEAIHVMSKVYGIERQQIANELYGLFLDDIIGSENKPIILKTLSIFKETKMDFVDCLLIANHLVNHNPIFTFDKKANNYIKRQTT